MNDNIRARKLLKAVCAAIIAAVLTISMWPVVRISVGKDVWITQNFKKAEQPVRINFIHSVQKTPVEENLIARPGYDFILKSTKYQFFGVGLPFLESDGAVFVKDGDYFVMDGMGRRFKKIDLRTGVGTKLVVTVGDTEHRMYEKFPPGTKIHLSCMPLIEAYLL